MIGPRIQGAKADKGPKVALKVEARVGVQATSEIIWQLLSDLDTWSQWSGIYPNAAGRLKIGERLRMTLALPGEAHRDFEPVIVDWMPEEQILWRDLRWGGWVSSTRFIEIEELENKNCIVSNGEQFPGFVGERYLARHKRALRRGYTEFGERLKEAAETLAAQRRGAPVAPTVDEPK